MKGKRGLSWLAENIGSIVLAILGLILLFYLLFVLIDAAFTKQSRLQAAGTLADIYTKINALQENSTDTYNIQSPVGWWLVSFSNNKEYNKIQQKCIKQNCLCVCRGASFVMYDCQKEVFCEVVSKPVLDENKAEIKIRITTMKKIEIKNLKDYYEIKE